MTPVGAMVVGAAGSLDPQGPAAREMSELWWLMVALGLLVLVIVLALLVAGLLRSRSGEPAVPEPPGPHLVRRWVVVGGAIMPLVIVTGVLVATVQTMRDVPGPADAEAAGTVQIEVVGHQWWWEVRYPDHGVATANELHLPVGEPVAIHLTSADVIHSFWVPSLGGKLDALPDKVNTLVLQADEAGEHASHCAEFCGLQHARMGLSVVAEPPADFEAWTAARAADPPAPTDASTQRGQRVFLDSGCAGCHTIAGTPAGGTGGPDLSDLAERPSLGALTVANTPDALARWVTDPHRIKGGVDMPATELSDADRDALLSYLGSLS